MSNLSYVHLSITGDAQNISNTELYIVDDLQPTLILIDDIGKWVQLISTAFALLGNSLILLGSRVNNLSLYRVLLRNLALADLVYAITQVFRIHARFNKNEWIFGDILCRFAVLSNISISNSMFMVTFIALERYRSLIHPLKPKLSHGLASQVTILLWICAFLVDLPILIFSTVTSELGYQECYTNFPPEHLTKYSISAFIIIFGLPFLITSACHVKIGMHFSQRKRAVSNPGDPSGDECLDFTRCQRKRQSQKKMVLMLSLVLGMLVMTTLPNHIYVLWQSLAPKNSSSSRRTFVTLFALCHLVHIHAWTNSLIYSIMDRKFRRNLRQSICGGRSSASNTVISSSKKSRDLNLAFSSGGPTKKMSMNTANAANNKKSCNTCSLSKEDGTQNSLL